MDEPEVQPATITNSDAEIKELLGLFDVPAFARRGQDLEYALDRLYARCLRERSARLDMVRVRLRQWSGAVSSPAGWRGTSTAPIDDLWPLAGAEAPVWAASPAPPRRR